MHGILHDDRTEALLRACRLHYDDDVPRLAYADYLLERGDPFGEFVKLSVEHPEFDEPGHDVRGNDPYNAWGRWRHLYSEHGGAWLGRLWTTPGRCRFERGLLTADAPYRCTEIDELEMHAGDRLSIVAGVMVSIQTAVDIARELPAWLAWDHPGLLEVRVHAGVTPGRYADTLGGYAGPVPSVKVVRFAHTLARFDRGEDLDASWAEEFHRTYARHTAARVRGKVRVEVRTGGGNVRLDRLG